jgi:hypothetical protein
VGIFLICPGIILRNCLIMMTFKMFNMDQGY